MTAGSVRTCHRAVSSSRPSGRPALGVELDRERVEKYMGLYRTNGGAEFSFHHPDAFTSALALPEFQAGPAAGAHCRPRGPARTVTGVHPTRNVWGARLARTTTAPSQRPSCPRDVSGHHVSGGPVPQYGVGVVAPFDPALSTGSCGAGCRTRSRAT